MQRRPIVRPAARSIFCALLAAGPLPLAAQEDALLIRGTVVDSTFRPIPSALVYLDSASRSGWTDSAGMFSLSPVAPGPHELHVRKRAWQARSYAFTAPPDLHGEVDVGLILLQPGPEPTATITGTVRDAVTDDPLEGTGILLNGVPVAEADADGAFRAAGRTVSWGSNVLTVRRIGYGSLTDIFWVHEPAAEFTFTIRLRPASVMLPEVVVVGDRIIYEFGRMRGFWQRREAGFGHFVTREEIEARNATETSDILLGIPGLTVQRSGFRTRILNTRRAGSCQLGVFVDGIPLVGDLDVDAYMRPDWIEGIEVYTGAAGIPAEFNRTGRECGAIVIWTR